VNRQRADLLALRPGPVAPCPAILAADVVGYSRLMGEDEAGTHARLKALRKDFIEPKIAASSSSPAMVPEFASVVDVVQCAVDTQLVSGSA
jgi:adenylate cyclase